MQAFILSISELKQFRRFLGERTVRYFLLGIATGIALFASEISLAYSLQLLLFAVGLTSAANLRVPGFLHDIGFTGIFLVLLASGAARGALAGIASYLKAACVEHFSHTMRGRLLDWAILTPASGGTEGVTLFTLHLPSAVLSMSTAQAASVNLVTSCCLVGYLLAISLPVTLYIFALLAVLAIPMHLIQKKATRNGRQVARLVGQVVSRFVMSMKNLLLLRVSGGVSRERAALHALSDEALKKRLLYQSLAGSLTAYSQLVAVVLIASIGVWKKMGNVGTSAIVVSYFYILFRFLQQLPSFVQNLAGARFESHHARLLFEWWRKASREFAFPGTAEAVPPSGNAGALPAPLQKPIGWSLDGISYAYPGAAAPVFPELSLHVPPGSALVLTGPSGSGKSTLLALLLGQISAQRGSLRALMDEEALDIEAAAPRLLASVGYVGPESFLIEGTIRSNLVYGLERNPSAAELESALSLAGCSFVENLPDGLEHPLSFLETGLSAGQKQRLSLARALLRDPRALVLDEATSNLDTETERKLLETLERLKGRVTLIIATHRTALLALADQRLVLGGPANA